MKLSTALVAVGVALIVIPLPVPIPFVGVIVGTLVLLVGLLLRLFGV
jgi:vacuolar-type H+-ATPase subunit I/STV1